MAADTGRKLTKYRSTSKSGVSVRDERITLVGDRDKHISVDAKTGAFISGPTSILAAPEQIRISGLWQFRPEVLSTVASTIVTPHPVLQLNIPYNNSSIFESLIDMFKDTLA